MVKYGTRTIQIEQLDEDGTKSQAETSVLELIYHELMKDELTFSEPIYAKIYQLFIIGINEKTLYSSSYLKRLEDQEIVRFVSDVESDIYELSTGWLSNYNITTRSEGDRLNETVMNALYSFKSFKIEELINSIRKKLEQAESLADEELMNLMAEQMAYEKVKIKFAEKLGRIILR